MDKKTENAVKALVLGRNTWRVPLTGIPAVAGYALLAFNLVLINLYPENSETFAYVNAIGALVLYGLIHALFHLYTGALNGVEQEKIISILKLLNSIAELNGTFDADIGLMNTSEDDNEHGT